MGEALIALAIAFVGLLVVCGGVTVTLRRERRPAADKYASLRSCMVWLRETVPWRER